MNLDNYTFPSDDMMQTLFCEALPALLRKHAHECNLTQPIDPDLPPMWNPGDDMNGGECWEFMGPANDGISHCFRHRNHPRFGRCYVNIHPRQLSGGTWTGRLESERMGKTR